jgi:hypothetical protein
VFIFWKKCVRQVDIWFPQSLSKWERYLGKCVLKNYQDLSYVCRCRDEHLLSLLFLCVDKSHAGFLLSRFAFHGIICMPFLW